MVCNGQENMSEFRDKKRNSVMEAVNWSCSRVLANHEWVSEFYLIMREHDIHETLKFEIDVPCIVQWCLLWYSTLARANAELVHEGRMAEMCSRVIDVALQSPFKTPK